MVLPTSQTFDFCVKKPPLAANCCQLFEYYYIYFDEEEEMLCTHGAYKEFCLND